MQAVARAGSRAHDEEGGAAQLAEKGIELMSALRDLCNDTEQAVDDELWSLPKYREMLYLL
jgi:glutamine synthetase type III